MEKSRSGRRYLSGVVWDVYLYILTSNEPVGVREIGRGLNLSSPSLAQYHVNHLLEMKLISQTKDGRYVAEEKSKLEALRNFVLLRGTLISRMIIYGAFTLGLTLFYILTWSIEFSFRDLFVLAIGIISTCIFFYEAYSQHRGIRTGVQRV